MEAVQQAPRTLLQELAEWSTEKLPLWQQDALRRLSEKSDLTGADFEELTTLCLQEAGYIEPEAEKLKAIPFATKAAIIPAGTAPSLSLLAMENGERINALAPRQCLSFTEKGVTVVYGDNGSGKSGYARVLRRACRARHRGDAIKPNVYDDPTSEPASIEIRYRLGDDEHAAQWLDGENELDDLRAVSFFDSKCAVVHANEANPLAYTPLGLDLLPRLTAACEQVRRSSNERGLSWKTRRQRL